MEVKVIDAILSLNLNAKVVVKYNNDIDNCEIEWHDGTEVISKADIRAEQIRLQAIEDASS
jgi:electron transfer flavoprotein alpha/beta subunit|tara:strand:+ start:71 stop:253 length:183 start_codon:yes stop_codon:yes gene_type:complete